MDNKIFEQIKKNVEEMKRFRPTLRTQVEEVLDGIATQITKEGNTECYINVKNRNFFIGERYENNCCEILYANDEFVEIGGISNYEPEYIKGFDGYKHNFTNDDIIFLAENIEEILEKIKEKLEEENKVLEPLVQKLNKIQEVLK